jgi:hypothetical protein
MWRKSGDYDYRLCFDPPKIEKDNRADGFFGQKKRSPPLKVDPPSKNLSPLFKGSQASWKSQEIQS